MNPHPQHKDLVRQDSSDRLCFSSSFFKGVHFPRSAQNKRALCVFDCEMSCYSTIDMLTPSRKQAFSRLQTNVRIVDTKMAAGTDYYLQVIKLLRLSVACQQLSNYFVNLPELFMRRNVNRGVTELPVDTEARLKNTKAFHMFRCDWGWKWICWLNDEVDEFTETRCRIIVWITNGNKLRVALKEGEDGEHLTHAFVSPAINKRRLGSTAPWHRSACLFVALVGRLVHTAYVRM